MSANKILCPNGHLVGIENNKKIIIKNSGRVVTIYKDGCEHTLVEITCERCKGKRKILT